MYKEILSDNVKFWLTDKQYNVIDKILFLKQPIHCIEGKPGTGKTIVAAHLFERYLSKGKNTIITTSNFQLRNSIIESLKTDKFTSKTHLNNLILGVGSFNNQKSSRYDLLIVDEAQGINGLIMQCINLEDLFLKILNSAKKCSTLWW